MRSLVTWSGCVSLHDELQRLIAGLWCFESLLPFATVELMPYDGSDVLLLSRNRCSLWKVENKDVGLLVLLDEF
jgi:hypothetical protein